MSFRCRGRLNVFNSISTTHKTVRSYAAGCTNDVSVFTASHRPDTFQWNAIMRAHIDADLFDSALSVFSSMRQANARPDHFTFPIISRAISSINGAVALGEEIHCLGIQMGFDSDAYFCNTMMDVYARCGRIGSARQMFDEMRDRDVVSWTSIISGYIRLGDISESFGLFDDMQSAGLQPSPVTLAVMFRACSAVKNTYGVRQLLGFAMKSGVEYHELVQNSILAAFNKVGCLWEASMFFSRIATRGVVSWNLMMAGYLSTGDTSRVIHCFERLTSELVPSHETLTLVISAIAKCVDLLRGQKVHCYAIKSAQIDAILRCSLIDFYAKCGELASSVQLFEESHAKNSVTWSVMMWGCMQNDRFSEAIDLYRRMQIAGFQCSSDTLRVLVAACTNVGSLQLGKGAHGYLMRNMLVDDPDMKTLDTSILNMYAKCGSIILARNCFDRMPVKDIVAWSSMVEGYAIHGLGFEALDLFYQMQEEGIEPNSITFLSLLSACSHSGLVSEGCEVFDCMTRRFSIKPELNHYTCMVDLLGRSGKLHEALGLIQNMTVKPDGRIWGALLASCRLYADGELANFASQRLFDLDKDNVGYHVVLSNIHSTSNKWDEAENVRKLMAEKDFKKKPGWSCIEEKERIHMFVSGDRSHTHFEELYKVVGCLTRHTEQLRSL